MMTNSGNDYLRDGKPTKACLDAIVCVAEAAEILGVSKSAVLHAANAGRIEGKKLGGSWVLLRHSVRAYEVASYRVKAGKAAQRRRSAHQKRK